MVAVSGPPTLSWDIPVPQNQAALNAFSCTTPDRRIYRGGKRYHPLEWEFAAQAALRDVRPPVRPPEFALTGWHGSELVAAARFEVDRGPRPNLGLAWIYAAGVSLSWRGHSVGDALVDAVLDRMTERALELGLDVLLLGAKVHKRNVNSQKLLQRNGWAITSLGKGGGKTCEEVDYDEWGAELPISE